MTDEERDTLLPERPPWLEPVADEAGDAGRRPLLLRLLIGGAAAGVILLFAALIWILYSRGEAPQGEILVRAPEGPVKVEPADRGGMKVPDQDKLVFDRITGEAPQVEEKLRPEAEAPLGRPEAPALERAAPSSEEVVGAAGSAVEAAAPPAQPVPEAASVDAAWAIQIAAFRQKWHADTWLSGAQEDYRDVFAGLTPRVEETERDRAKYYRIRFGPLLNRAAAETKCEEVRRAGLNCFVVPPGR